MLSRSLLFKIASLLSFLVAVYHAIGIFYAVNSSPPLRHLVFVVVCLVCCYGFLKRPKYFIYFFFVLLVQQLYSHGWSLLFHWFHGKIDWISLLLLIILPALFYLLARDAKNKMRS